MARYNPNHDSSPIHTAAAKWSECCLLADGSIFQDELKLWTPVLIDELDHRFVRDFDEGAGSFFDKLKSQLSESSAECRQLMAEALWILMLFQSNVGASRKRENIQLVWSWSGKELPGNHPMLSDAVLDGLGSAGTAYNTYRWREAAALIAALRNFKRRSHTDRQQMLNDPWSFAEWLNSIPDAHKRQLRHVLSHLLFPDSFERISSEGDKRRFLAAYNGVTEQELCKWDLIKIDRALFDLRQRLKAEHGGEIDFYEVEFAKKWREQAIPKHGSDDEHSTPLQSTSSHTPINLILYGPPGTGKTHRLMTEFVPRYSDEGGQRYEFVTFHQSYAYEDFVEGIRPVTKDGKISYEVRAGVLKRLCDRARQAPEKRHALIIDEINRGNVAKIFGELITLIEIDKRIRVDGSGGRAKDCTGLEVTLPHSGERFGVPMNVDLIGTMNTADRSIALLDTALRRRFRFEGLMPQPHLLGSIPDGNGDVIDLRRLLEALNSRLAHLLHRDRSIGHSYFFNVRTFEELQKVFTREILPLLQELFYDDWRQMRLVLADQMVGDQELQLIRTHHNAAESLFPNIDASEIGDGEAFEIAREDEITPDAIRKIYEPPE